MAGILLPKPEANSQCSHWLPPISASPPSRYEQDFRPVLSLKIASIVIPVPIGDQFLTPTPAGLFHLQQIA